MPDDLRPEERRKVIGEATQGRSNCPWQRTRGRAVPGRMNRPYYPRSGSQRGRAAPPRSRNTSTTQERHADENEHQDEVKKSSHHDDLEDETKKRPLNALVIGHVDTGKSTLGAQILSLSRQVGEKEAKGKTVEVGTAYLETETTRFKILYAPGHKSYVPNMISGASQADIVVLVISARKGEFETGYGQTREYLQLAKTLGVSKLLVVVNKMDDPIVEWAKERFDEIELKLTTFLKSSGYNVKKDVQFLPISGLLGTNMKTRMDKSICPWWKGSCLFEALDAIEVPTHDPEGPFRMPIMDKFKGVGTVVMGNIQSGNVREGDNLMIMPKKVQVNVTAIFNDEYKVGRAGPGVNLGVMVSGIEEEDILVGFVLCSLAKPIPAVSEFFAHVHILELLDNGILGVGYKSVLHIHTLVEECVVVDLLAQIDPQTNRHSKRKLLSAKKGDLVLCRVQVSNSICIEKFDDFPQLGLFTLRTEGKTVAVGKVTDLATAND